ncbi:hypothetical protein XELAEV_18000997mg [Xenopus laevis]|nr:hypothetical protein XELAEV_18000997mg [Xenopus laevis]
MKLYINCCSKGIVYLITCTTCGKQYVGCTTRSFKEWIEQIRIGTRGGDFWTKLRKKEVYWIFHLQTRLPLGLNYTFDVTCYT